MQQKGFIENYSTEEQNKLKELLITLKEDRPEITVKRVSKPGQRIYIKTAELKPLVSGLGIAIISTSKGLMTNTEAKKQHLGGELICEIF